ncbi:glutamate receptor ionotropic, kainate 2-like [Centruroides vittatus]|uniref:glutamate receptor ionotropic, kainate 2-like n=1 Tax=Centruroides vittatus TaxID=120091 RepID=UPI00350F69B0
MFIELLIISQICFSDCWRVAVVFEERELFSGDILRNIHNTMKSEPPACYEPKSQAPSRLSYRKTAVLKWTKRNTVGVVSIFNNKKNPDIEDIIQSLEKYNISYINATNNCRKPCAENDNNIKSKLNDFKAIINDMFGQYIMHKTIVLRGYASEESPISMLLGNSGYPLLQIHLHNDIKNQTHHLYNVLKKFFAMWNMPDTNDDGRLMILLAPNKAVKDTILMLIEERMHGTRAKLLILDDPNNWDDVFSVSAAYIIDIIVVTETALDPGYFPLSVQLSSKVASSESNSKCYKKDDKSAWKKFGNRLLKRIVNNLPTCCIQNEKLYYLWRGYPSDNGTVILQPIATWSKNFGISTIDIIRQRESPVLRVAIKEYQPLIKLRKENDTLYLENSMCKAVLDYISRRMNMKYELLGIEGDWGTKENGSWSGAIKMVLDGDADIIPFLALTARRNDVIDFTHPLLIIQNGILVRKPQEPSRAFLFLRPFDKNVWIGIIVCLPVVSFVFYVVNRYSAYIYGKSSRCKIGLSSFSNCFWYVFGATLQQGGIYTPDSISGRMIAGTWWLATVVIFSTYSGNLIAFLTFPEAKWIVENIKDIINTPHLKIYMGKSAPIIEEMETSTTDLMNELHKQYSIRGEGVRMNSYTKKELRAGRAIYMDDIYHLLEIINKDFHRHGRCRFSIPHYRFYQLEMSMGLRRGSPYFRSFNQIIKELWQTGMLSHWHKKYSWIERKCQVTDTTLKGGGRNVELKDLQGAFYLLCLGLATSVLTIMIEQISRVIDKLKLRKKLRKIK